MQQNHIPAAIPVPHRAECGKFTVVRLWLTVPDNREQPLWKPLWSRPVNSTPVSPSPETSAKAKRILAIASGGGHWQQLMLMREAFAHHEAHFVTTMPGLPEQFGLERSRIIPDCNGDEKFAMLRTGWALFWLMLRLRPHVVISTGALPGLMALALGRMLGARTIWVDSVANAEEMSKSGRTARRFAHLWMSQWDHVARDAGAEYAGAIL